MLLRLLPEPTTPAKRIDIPDQPAPSLHPTPASRDLSATTGRSAASAATGTQCLRFPPLARSLSQPLEAYDPGSTLSTLAFSRSVPEPQTRLTPPSRRAPPGQSSGTRQARHGRTARPPAFDATSILLTTPQQRTPAPGHPGQTLSGTSSWSPPDASSAPLPDRSPRRPSANAARGGLAPSP